MSDCGNTISTDQKIVGASLSEALATTRNFLLRSGDSYVAFDAMSNEDLVISDAKLLSELDELIQKRQEFGREITRRLIEAGFNSADNSPTKVG
jgi:hypothetical protein